MRCEVRATRYLGEQRLSSGSVCGAAVGILVRCSCCSCPLIRVAQRRKVTTVLNAGIALKLFTHSITVKDVAPTGLTLERRRGENQRGRFMKVNWPKVLPSLIVSLPSKPICPWIKTEPIFFFSNSHCPSFIFTKSNFAGLGHANLPLMEDVTVSQRVQSSVNLHRPQQYTVMFWHNTWVSW